jgi:N-acetylneuraminic acid mutarotase
VDSLNVEIYDSLSFHPTGKWIACQSMTNGRKFACAAELDSTIYCIGGIIYNSKNGMSTFSNSVEKYDIRTGKWSNSSVLPQKIYWASSVSLNGKIYVIGGENENGEKLSSVYTYDPASGWVLNGNLPAGISGTSSCVYENNILITGGKIVDSVDLVETNSNEILRYNPVTKKTDTLSYIDGDNRVHHQSVVFKDHLYLISGTNLENENLSTMLVYDLKTNKVCDTISVPHPSCFFSAWVNKGRLYIAGGANSPILNKALIYENFEYLDLNSSRSMWVSLKNLSQPVFSAVSVTTNNALYMVGGATGNSSGQETNSVNVYYP